VNPYIILGKYELSDSTMLYINKQVDYGLQLLLALGQLSDGSSLSLRAFAEERNISFLFLQRIAGRLKKAGLVYATKGAKGGYYLARPAAELHLKDIIEAIEGDYGTVDCTKDGKVCPNEATCTSKPVFHNLQKDIVASMSKYSLADMANMH